MAARIMHRQLEALEGMFAEHPEKERIVESINADIHRLVKDAIDRAEGTARQSVDHTTNGKDMPSPVTINMTPEQAAEAYASAINPEGE